MFHVFCERLPGRASHLEAWHIRSSLGPHGPDPHSRPENTAPNRRKADGMESSTFWRFKSHENPAAKWWNTVENLGNTCNFHEKHQHIEACLTKNTICAGFWFPLWPSRPWKRHRIFFLSTIHVHVYIHDWALYRGRCRMVQEHIGIAI